jgi:hypothetical protein
MGDGDKNTAQGDQTRRKGRLNQVFPCPIPDGCKKRDPQDYKQWGRHEFKRKSKEELKIAVGIQLVENCILTKSVRVFSPAFLMEKNSNLIECKQTQFMIDYLGGRTPEDLSGKKRGTKDLAAKIGETESKNIIGWMYTEWTYNNMLEEEIFEIPDTADFGWMGDGNQTEFKITGLPTKKAGTTEKFSLTVGVNGKKMLALGSDTELGSDGVINYDYSFDRETGKIKFTKPPPNRSRITASGSFLLIGPGKKYHGRSLSVSKANRIEEKRELDEPEIGRFYLGGRHVAKNTVAVEIAGVLQEPYKNYELKGLMKNGKPRLYLEFNKDMRNEIGEKEITVTYAEFVAHNTVEGFREVEKKDFEDAKREALNHLSYFSETIRNANTAQYNKDFGNEMNLEEIRTWVNSWKPPTRIKLTEKIYQRKFYYKCETPGCGMKDLWQCREQNLEETVHIAPNCTSNDPKRKSCGKSCKVARQHYVCKNKSYEGCLKPRPSLVEIDGVTVCPRCGGPTFQVDNLTYLDLESTSISLHLDDYFEASKDQGPIVTEALPVYYLYGKPEPGGQLVVTDAEVLNAAKTPNLKDVAFRLQQQLRDIHTNAETNKKPIYLHFWGYTDRKSGCEFNEALSERRGEWVWRKLVTILTRDHEFYKYSVSDDPPYLYIQTHVFDKTGSPIPKKVVCAKIMKEHGCGRGLADESNSYKEEDYRVIIIELSDDPDGKLS